MYEKGSCFVPCIILSPGVFKFKFMESISKIGNVNKGYDEKIGLVFSDVFSITKDENNNFTLKEECDFWRSEVLTKNQLIKLSEEIKEFAEQ